MAENLTIDIDAALTLRDQGALLIDARTPSEYAEATIPGAINVPIFSDAERVEVGTLYRQQGKREATRLGVRLVAPKIPGMIDAVDRVRADGRTEVIVFCWRGGMRSKALTTFLRLAGIPARQLTGGHKAFRAHVRRFFERGEWGRLLVLRGLTGVGKTRLLTRLAAEGYPVVDLEGLACHRGSAFGGLGLDSQPTQKAFEAGLWEVLRKVPPGGWALAEGESKHIGRIKLPPEVYLALQRETTLWINASLDYRVQLLLEEYPAADQYKEDFVAPIEALRRRLGKEQVGHMLDLLQGGEWQALVRELMVHYYDPLYNHTKPQERIEIDIEPEEEGIGRLKQAIAGLLERRAVAE